MGYILGAAIIGGACSSSARKKAKREEQKKIAKLKKEIRELKGEQQSCAGKVLSFLFS